jgi:hypothetical protein
MRVALRIEYYKGGTLVMIVPCPRSLDEAKKIALESFTGFNADLAKILDNKRKLVGVVKR